MVETHVIRCVFPSGDMSPGAKDSLQLFKTDIVDGIELVDDRWWTMAIEYPDSLEDCPVVFLLQYDDRRAERGEDYEGAIWCYPEDLDAIITNLTLLRDALRKAACDDAKRVPRPNWGGMLRSSSAR